MLVGLAASGASLCAGPANALRLGVNTHFEQGWPRSNFAKVGQIGARSIRDVVTWGKVERTPGHYEFTEANSGHVAEACRNGWSVVLMIGPRSTIYDGARAVTSARGQAALGRWAATLVTRFPCVSAVEIGNELNTNSGVWPSPADKPAIYISMLRAVRAALDAQPRKVFLLGGSSVGVSVDWHKRLFAAGELPLIDAVAVHPYAATPERLPGQFARLRQAMRDAGQERPIWVTEFGLDTPTPDVSPTYLVKTVAVMSAAGVMEADWYALLDEPWFHNMGLFGGGGPKPALSGWQLAMTKLLRAGAARRIATSNPTTFVYRFESGPTVLWGNGQPIQFSSAPTLVDSRGRTISAPTSLTSEPIILLAGSYKLG